MSRETSPEGMPVPRERYERRGRAGRSRMLDEVCEQARLQPQARDRGAARSERGDAGRLLAPARIEQPRLHPTAERAARGEPSLK